MSTIDPIRAMSLRLRAARGQLIGQTEGPAAERPDDPEAVEYGNMQDQARALQAKRRLDDPATNPHKKAIAANFLANWNRRRAATADAFKLPASVEAENIFREAQGVPSDRFGEVEGMRADLEAKRPGSTRGVTNQTILRRLDEQQETAGQGYFRAGEEPVDSVRPSQVGDFLQQAGPGAIRGLNAAIAQTAGSVSDLVGAPETGEQYREAADFTRSLQPAPQTTGGRIGEIVGAVLPSAAGAVSPAALPSALATLGVQTYGGADQRYRETIREQGGTPDAVEGALAGLSSAAAEVIGEAVGISRLGRIGREAADTIVALAKGGRRADAIRLTGRVLESAGVNAGEEAVTQIVNNLSERAIYNEERRLTDDVGTAAVGGAIGGPIVAGAAAAGRLIGRGGRGSVSPASPQEVANAAVGGAVQTPGAQPGGGPLGVDPNLVGSDVPVVGEARRGNAERRGRVDSDVLPFGDRVGAGEQAGDSAGNQATAQAPQRGQAQNQGVTAGSQQDQTPGNRRASDRLRAVETGMGNTIGRLSAELQAERRAARTDELTKIGNRKQEAEDIERVYREADEGNESVAVVETDLANFKVVNDELGHEVGDRLLRAEAEALVEATRFDIEGRPGDTIGHTVNRVGGDEFPLKLRNIDDPAKADIVMQRANEIFARKVEAIIGDRLPKQAYPFIAWGTEIRAPRDARDAKALTHAAEQKVIPTKNRLKAERGVPESREELTRYLAEHRAKRGSSSPVAPQSTPAQAAAGSQARSEPSPQAVDRSASETTAGAVGTRAASDDDTSGLAAYARIGRGHARLVKNMRELTRTGTITPEGANVILEAFRDADTEHLYARAAVRTASREQLAALGKRFGQSGTPSGVSLNRIGQTARLQVAAFVQRGLVNTRARQGSTRADMEPVVATLHELGHSFYTTMATAEDRAIVRRSFESMSPKQRAAFLAEGLSESRRDRIAKYFAANPDEWLAQSFAEYVISNRVPDTAMRPLLQRLGDVFKRAVERLKGRRRLSPEMESLLERLRSGRAYSPSAALGAETTSGASDPATARPGAASVGSGAEGSSQQPASSRGGGEALGNTTQRERVGAAGAETQRPRDDADDQQQGSSRSGTRTSDSLASANESRPGARGEPSRTVLASSRVVAGSSPNRTREPWEMTVGEWAMSVRRGSAKGQSHTTKRITEREMQEHEKIVLRAISENKPVPESVLAQYPDLANPSEIPDTSTVKGELTVEEGSIPSRMAESGAGRSDSQPQPQERPSGDNLIGVRQSDAYIKILEDRRDRKIGYHEAIAALADLGVTRDEARSDNANFKSREHYLATPEELEVEIRRQWQQQQEQAEDDNRRLILAAKNDPTVLAKSGDSNRFADVYGVDDWLEFSRKRRQEIIDEDKQLRQQEAEAEAAADAERELAQQEYEKTEAAIFELAEVIRDSVGVQMVNSLGGSWYGHYPRFGYKLRISDHAQVDGGGFNHGTGERYGQADIQWIVESESRIPTRKEIRNTIAQHRQNNEDGVTTVYLSKKQRPTSEDEGPASVPGQSESTSTGKQGKNSASSAPVKSGGISARPQPSQDGATGKGGEQVGPRTNVAQLRESLARVESAQGKTYARKMANQWPTLATQNKIPDELHEYRSAGYVTRSNDGKYTLHVVAGTDSSTWRLVSPIDVTDQYTPDPARAKPPDTTPNRKATDEEAGPTEAIRGNDQQAQRPVPPGRESRPVQPGGRETRVQASEEEVAERQPLAGATGRTATLELADGQSLPVTYRLVEAESLLPSHDARKGFAVNRGADPNERRYEDPTEGKASRDTVKSIAASPKPSLLLTDTPSALDGPPVVGPTGIVLGGNARTMGLQLAYSQGGKPAETIKTATLEAAGRFGIDQAQYAGFKNPVIVRVLSEEDAGKPGELSRVLNQGLTTGKTRATESASRGAKIDERAAVEIAAAVGDGSLAEALSDGPKSARIIRALRTSGAFSDADLISMIGAGKQITPSGKSAIEDALVGAAIPDVRTLAETPPAVRQVVVRALPSIVRLNRPAKSGGDPGFKEDLSLALQGLAELRASDSRSIDDLLTQQVLTPQPWRTPRAIALMRLIDENKPTQVANRLGKYADAVQDAQSGQERLIGGVQDIDEAFEEHIGTADTEGQTGGALFGPSEESDLRRITTDELGFFSRVQRFIADKIKGPQPSDAILKAMKSGQLSHDELKWTGLDDWLTQKGANKVTPAELQKFVAENRVTLNEIVKSDGSGDNELADATRRYDEAAEKLLRIIRKIDQRDAAMSHVIDQVTFYNAGGPSALSVEMAYQNAVQAYSTDKQDKLRSLGAFEAFKEAREAHRAQTRARDARRMVNTTAYRDFTLPGGENYREVLLTLPENTGYTIRRKGTTATSGNYDTREEARAAIANREDAEDWEPHKVNMGGDFKSEHFYERNIIAHMRTTDRTTPDGKRVLFAEEIQSDWHQAGRDKGYRLSPEEFAKLDSRRRELEELGTSATTEQRQEWADIMNRQNEGSSGPPQAPFSKTWHEMAFRRLLRIAAEGGYDAVGWTTGKQQVDRYRGLATQIDRVRWSKQKDGDVIVIVHRAGSGRNYEMVAGENGTIRAADLDINSTVADRTLEEVFGVELARRIKGEVSGDIRGTDITIGGEGMRTFYDSVLPRYASKFGNKFGAKAIMGTIETGAPPMSDAERQQGLDESEDGFGENVHILPITPEMRTKIKAEGLPLFGPSVDDPGDPGKFIPTPAANARVDRPGPSGVIPDSIQAAGPSSGIPPLVTAPEIVLELAAFDATRAETVGGPGFIGRGAARLFGRADTYIKSVAQEIRRGGVTPADKDGATERSRQAANEAAAKSVYHRLRGDDEEAKRYEKLADRLRALVPGDSTQRGQDAQELRTFASKLGQGFSRLAQQYENADAAKIKKIMDRLSRDERRQVGRIGLGFVKPSDVSERVRKAADAVQTIMDKGQAGLNAAADVGLKRRSPKGRYYRLRGSGLWMPMSLNAKGRAVLADFAKAGRESPKIQAMIDKMAAQRPDESREDIAEDLFDFIDSLSRGVNRYFERTRTMLPEEYIETDPTSILPGVIKKNARTVAAGRTFGGYDDTNSLPEVDQAIVIMRQYDPDAAARFSKYIGMELGKAPTSGNVRERAIARNVTTLQNVTKLSTLFGPIRNSGQPWINTADYGILPRLKAYFIDYPYMIGGMTSRAGLVGARARAAAERAGSTTGTIGPDADDTLRSRAGRTAQDVLMYPFRASQHASEVRADAIARNAAEQAIRDLASLEKPGFGIRKLLTKAANGFGTERSRQTIMRRMARLGLTPGRLSEIVASGRRLTEEELDLAGWHMAHDTQFAMTTASKPLFYENHPAAKILTQYKMFGMRQSGLIVERIVKEGARGNFVPAMQFGLAALVAGELLALLRDWIKGEDQSVIASLRTKADSGKASEAANRAIAHLTRGGLAGALGDTEFGIANYIAGPTVSTATDIAGAAVDIARRPTALQATTAARRLIERQAPGIGQVRAIGDVLTDNKKAAAIAKLRARGAWHKTPAERWEQRIFGPERYRSSGRTLMYHYAARAISSGDTDAAREYMTDLLRGLQGQELAAAIKGLRASAQSRSPLGGMSKDERADMLSAMSTTARREAEKLDAEWTRDYLGALREAATAARKGPK